MTQDAIIEKIKKLLRMKRGGTQGEIENALAMAAELARKHGIDLAGVNPDEEKEILTHETDILKLRMPLEAKLAANICVNFFNVQVCIQGGVCHWFIKIKNKITFVGTAWDIQVARYVFVFLQRHFRYAWNHRENKRLKNRDAFLHGMFLGLAAKLETARKKEVGVGLIHIDRAIVRRKDYLAKLFPDAKDQNLDDDNSDAWAAKRAGIIAGQKTEIRSGLDGKETSTRALPPTRAALPPAAGQLNLI